MKWCMGADQHIILATCKRKPITWRNSYSNLTHTVFLSATQGRTSADNMLNLVYFLIPDGSINQLKFEEMMASNEKFERAQLALWSLASKLKSGGKC